MKKKVIFELWTLGYLICKLYIIIWYHYVYPKSIDTGFINFFQIGIDLSRQRKDF